MHTATVSQLVNAHGPTASAGILDTVADWLHDRCVELSVELQQDE